MFVSLSPVEHVLAKGLGERFFARYEHHSLAHDALRPVQHDSRTPCRSGEKEQSIELSCITCEAEDLESSGRRITIQGRL